MSTLILSPYKKNKWENHNLRKKIEKNREIGSYYRHKENKKWKFKLQKRRRSKRRELRKSTIDIKNSYKNDSTYGSDDYFGDTWQAPQIPHAMTTCLMSNTTNPQNMAVSSKD